MPQTCPPSFEEIALQDGLAAWEALVEGVGDYWWRALDRNATPLDFMRDWRAWLRAASNRRRCVSAQWRQSASSRLPRSTMTACPRNLH